MMYHAESLAQNGFKTFVIGNKGKHLRARDTELVYNRNICFCVLGSKPIPSLLSIPHVEFLYLPNSPRPVPGLPFLLTAPQKVIHQVFSILHTLFMRMPEPPEFIIVQVCVLYLVVTPFLNACIHSGWFRLARIEPT